VPKGCQHPDPVANDLRNCGHFYDGLSFVGNRPDSWLCDRARKCTVRCRLYVEIDAVTAASAQTHTRRGQLP
jgi:heterodisulfide reductase subunit C